MLPLIELLSSGWDSANWRRFFDFSLHYADLKNKKVLELGCGCDNAGLALWIASKGASEIVCSDYEYPREATQDLHRRYHVENLIRYCCVDALHIPFKNEFDVICFKSMLGGIVRNGSFDIAREVFRQISKALKENGILLFAENLEGSFFHMLLRKKFGAGKNNWRYFRNEELAEMIAASGDLEIIARQNVGILGCFGRMESQRIILGKLDRLFFERIFPESYRYIQFIAARKK